MKMSHPILLVALIVLTSGCAKRICGAPAPVGGAVPSVRGLSILEESGAELTVGGKTSSYFNNCDCLRLESPDDGRFGLLLSCGPTDQSSCGEDRAPDFTIRLMPAENGKTYRQSPEPSHPLLEVRDVAGLSEAQVTISMSDGVVVAGTFEANVDGSESKVTGRFEFFTCR